MFPRSLATAALLCAVSAYAADASYPEAEIKNDAVTAKLYLPDAERGYYRGTRFDWSGVIPSLKANGHEYFGQWFPKYDPKLHDAIMGPVEEFSSKDSSLGYDEAKAGGEFIRIGVGAVRKPEEASYQRFKTYDIVDGGKWTVKKGGDWIEFTHDLGDHNGYAYRYTKRIALAKGKAGMTIHHTLKNTGKKAIQTEQYNHNFFMLDGEPTGPDATVTFPFELKPQRPLAPEMAQVKGGTLSYNKELQPRQTVMTEFTGFGNTAADYDVRIENRKTGAGVRIQGDRPIAKIVYWSIRTTLCPEAYINLHVAPGKETKWAYNYTFYDVKKQ